eukprot:scaffold10336_cov100-Isochrysis_galbana.AAC.2
MGSHRCLLCRLKGHRARAWFAGQMAPDCGSKYRHRRFGAAGLPAPAGDAESDGAGADRAGEDRYSSPRSLRLC